MLARAGRPCTWYDGWKKRWLTFPFIMLDRPPFLRPKNEWVIDHWFARQQTTGLVQTILATDNFIRLRSRARREKNPIPAFYPQKAPIKPDKRHWVTKALPFAGLTLCREPCTQWLSLPRMALRSGLVALMLWLVAKGGAPFSPQLIPAPKMKQSANLKATSRATTNDWKIRYPQMWLRRILGLICSRRASTRAKAMPAARDSSGGRLPGSEITKVCQIR